MTTDTTQFIDGLGLPARLLERDELLALVERVAERSELWTPHLQTRCRRAHLRRSAP